MTQRQPEQSSKGVSLSARLLLLTAVFVMIAEFLIYAPSISRFRKVYLENIIAESHLAGLALEATADAMVSEDLENELLFHAGAYAIVLNRAERRMLALSKDMPPKVDRTLDLRDASATDWLPAAFDTLFQEDNRVLRVVARSPKDSGVTVEVVIDETPMRMAMYDYSTRILQLSVVISLITGCAVFLSLQWLLVGPMRRVMHSMGSFQEDPEDEARIIVPGARLDEIGEAERQLAGMQRDIRAALHQKSRLATLGAAVAKINHDLRNSLATAMLVSDKLAQISDPEVQKVAPRLFGAIDRAVHLCSQTLNFVGDGTPKVRLSLVNLHALALEVEDMLKTFCEGDPKHLAVCELQWQNRIDPEIEIEADNNQLIRVIENLARNSAQAGASVFTLDARLEGERIFIDISDNGPGFPPQAMENLFQPFSGSAGRSGTGLGLVIVRDVVRAHDGDIVLAKSDETGVIFRIELPTFGNAS
ncbi:MAG: HAMP domain-containing histidine kinase [Rhodospirillales bacterium]|jgi:signal transduction histidine kinase|nr:HAMP domain-containing histidine kinase [Rhodospirillales bacterium]